MPGRLPLYRMQRRKSSIGSSEPATFRNVAPELDWLLRMSEEEFRASYRGTAVLRTKRRGMARNAAIALGNSKDDRAIPILGNALAFHDEPLVRGHAAWALGQYENPVARDALENALRSEIDDSARSEVISALDRDRS